MYMPKASLKKISLVGVLLFACNAFSTVYADIPNSIGIVTAADFLPPPAVPGQSDWLAVPQTQQELNLCVPTAASMVLAYFGFQYPPRQLKIWSRGLLYDPTRPFNDFTTTYFSDLLSGLQAHGILWTNHLFSNDDSGFANGIQQIESQLDQGLPVMVDTSLYTGHTFVVAGYDHTNGILIIRDPFIPPPGIREIKLSDFSSIWNSTRVGSNIRGAIFTAPPNLGP